VIALSLACCFLSILAETTLMKHILETKHQEKGKPFKCAVIVNDIAELNVDKALIDQSAILQSDTVIAMQNGCVCSSA
jgi:G3E family GTPase